MKHGPIALIDKDLPIIAIAPRDSVCDKVVSNIEQVKSRHGTVIALATEEDNNLNGKADHVIHIPQTTSSLLSPVLTIIPLQLLAYHMAIRRGCDVDQPRNLAKSVTLGWQQHFARLAVVGHPSFSMSNSDAHPLPTKVGAP